MIQNTHVLVQKWWRPMYVDEIKYEFYFECILLKLKMIVSFYGSREVSINKYGGDWGWVVTQAMDWRGCFWRLVNEVIKGATTSTFVRFVQINRMENKIVLALFFVSWPLHCFFAMLLNSRNSDPSKQ